MSRYAVLDIETTGLSPAHHHRILEIAVVLVDDGGNVVYEWETLLDPQRDVGPSHVHGLTGTDLHGAPTFDQVAGEFESLLRGRVPVAHNLSFDAAFLAAEYRRMGYEVPLSTTSGLCTMRLASRYLPSGPRTLEACCDCIGCRIQSAHAALEDARATASLLAHYIARDDDFLATWADVIVVAQKGLWPCLPPTSVPRVTRRSSAVATQQHFLARLASRTPRAEMYPQANSYLALLDRVVLDRQLSRHEEEEIISVAQMMGLSREEAIGLHRIYLAALGRLALEDGTLTAGERQDLVAVAALLGLSEQDVDESLSSPAEQTSGCELGGFRLRPGNVVVFTGEAPGIARADLEYQARSLGLRVASSVSGKTTLLVAADPDSISGKARRARELGIPIVDYRTYVGMLQSIST